MWNCTLNSYHWFLVVLHIKINRDYEFEFTTVKYNTAKYESSVWRFVGRRRCIPVAGTTCNFGSLGVLLNQSQLYDMFALSPIRDLFRNFDIVIPSVVYLQIWMREFGFAHTISIYIQQILQNVISRIGNRYSLNNLLKKSSMTRLK